MISVGPEVSLKTIVTPMNSTSSSFPLLSSVHLTKISSSRNCLDSMELKEPCVFLSTRFVSGVLGSKNIFYKQIPSGKIDGIF